jgi:2-octaprenyl-6-methoxyphenol hydroxylase
MTRHPDDDMAALAAAPSMAWQLAVVGAGPAGLALALEAARKLPQARITLFDARALDKDVSADPRTLALALGSVQQLQRLQAWPAERAQPILQVHVSQQPPTFALGGVPAEVTMSASEMAVPMLGAVVSYGALVHALQQRWQAMVEAEPQRLASRFGLPVAQVRNLGALGRAGGVEIDAGIAERFDLAVIAEGGVFADQARKAVRHDYRQLAWVGQVQLQGAPAGLAVERFTPQGPLALLPLPQPLTSPSPAAEPHSRSAAMVWCVSADDDPVAPLDDRQRRLVLNHLLPAAAGEVTQVGPLKCFALGLNAERTLVDGAMVRIGNAAQTLHPVAGQGLNLGLRDAMVLVDALRRATPDGLGAVLRRLEWSRGPDRWAMIAATDFLARSFTWRWPGLGAARGLGLAAVQGLAPLKTALARQMMFGRR